MNKKRGLGVILFLAGIFILISSQSGITGNLISEQTSAVGSVLALVLIVGGVVLMASSESLENLVGIHDYDRNEEYQKLKGRLKYMQDNKLIGTDKRVSLGRYLKPSEWLVLKKTILEYLPEDLAKEDIEISVSGSLSRAKKGMRHERWGIKDMSADQFYLSDVDVNIVGKKPFNYIKANWSDAIIPKNQGRPSEKETFKITNEDFLTSREIKRGYMKTAPKWILDLNKKLSKYNFAGEKRPVNIKFRVNEMDDTERDILYKRK